MRELKTSTSRAIAIGHLQLSLAKLRQGDQRGALQQMRRRAMHENKRRETTRRVLHGWVGMCQRVDKGRAIGRMKEQHQAHHSLEMHQEQLAVQKTEAAEQEKQRIRAVKVAWPNRSTLNLTLASMERLNYHSRLTST